MVGLKTVWITIFGLFLLAACVPQTKQTECASNEAFNASLRTCVPVIGGTTAFIKVKTYSPALPISVYKNDSSTFPLYITVDNPYSQGYTVEWERVYFGTPSFFAGNTLTTSFVPLSLASEIGAHFITAKIVANGQVVDSHTFQINVSDTPRPVIDSSTVTPSDYALALTPVDSPERFSFTVKNNGSVVSGSGYTVKWSVTKNGVNLPAMAETDAFSNVSTNGSNAFYLGTSGSPTFDPAALGVGNYVIKAIVGNTTPGEIVDEVQWSVTVQHPSLGNILSITSPAPGNTITTYNGLNYTQYTTYNFISGGVQPNFCVTLDDADGTYAGDGEGVQVKFYLNGIGGEICTKETDDGQPSQTICLNDANNCDDGTAWPFTNTFDTATLSFTNSSPTVQQNHKITARVIDKATGTEYSAANVIPSSGSYPIEWTVLNKPVNAAPVIAFGSTLPTGCTSSGAFSKINCAVTQGSNFTVSFTVSDDFYTGAANSAKFQIAVNLKYNGTDLTGTGTSCTKAFGATQTYTAGVGFTCVLSVPHYFSNVPLDPSNGVYSVVAQLQDEDSPVSPTDPKAAYPLTWTLNVTETNSTAPNINLDAQTAVDTSSNISRSSVVVGAADVVSELETINFNLHVTDPELDNFKYRVSLCTDGAACTSTQVLTSPWYLTYSRLTSVTPEAGNYILLNGFAYTLPENLLLTLGKDVDDTVGSEQTVYFKVDVQDVPSVLTTTIKTDSEIYSIKVLNVNPAPVITTTTAAPATNLVGAAYPVMVGYPFTINPGTVTDASGVDGVQDMEDTLAYQWYAKDATLGGATFKAITGATSLILKYTPDNTAPTSVELKLCVGDGTAANTIAAPDAGGNCSASSWFVAPRDNLAMFSAGPVTMNTQHAVWRDDQATVDDLTREVIYGAYIGTDKKIYVTKTVLNKNVTSGTTYSLDTSVETISFDAIVGGGPGDVTNISITGTKQSLYIAYLASNATSAALHPKLRRIDKLFANGVGSRTNTVHAGKMGFDYDGYDVTECSVCTASTDLAAVRSIVFGDGMADGDSLVINGVTFTAKNAPAGESQVCAKAGTCPTATDVADAMAAKINAHSSLSLQGITASAGGGTLSISGLYADDYLDWDGTQSMASNIVVLSGGMGKVFIQGSRWYLPIINSSLGGSSQNKVTVLSGLVDVNLQSAGIDVDDNAHLDAMGKIAAFDSALNSDGELVLATISGEITTPGRLSIYRYTVDGTGKVWSLSAGTSSVTNLFSSRVFQSVTMAPSTVGNSYIYLLAQEVSTLDNYMGRYPKSMASSGTENDMEGQVETSDSSGTYITDTLLKGPAIMALPNTSEARMYFHTTNKPRVARWKSDDTLSCGNCDAIGGSVKSASQIAITAVHSDLLLGTDGATGLTTDANGENEKDVIYALFSSSNGGGYSPQVGVFNVEAESIQSTSVDTVNHLFRPPYCK